MEFSGLIGSDSVIGPDSVSYGPSKSKSISKLFFHNIDLMIMLIFEIKPMNFWQTLSFLSMSLPVVQDDSLCTPIITWNSLTPHPHPKQYFPTHRLRFKTPHKHLKSQVIGQEICLNVYTNASFEWCTLVSLQFEQKKCYRRFLNEHHNLKIFDLSLPTESIEIYQ